jgi:2-amino-4-hydroxy-6-hydroxymethyldihydropteridine diphosphokinase
MTQVCIGLGSNVGDSKVVFQKVIEELSIVTSGVRVSSLYKTKPQEYIDQPDFYNCAVGLSWDKSFIHLLHLMLEIETKYGRVRDTSFRYGPRIIDLDLLWINGYCLHTPTLEVPHPRLKFRAFALVPLLELFPSALHPMDGAPFAISEELKIEQGISFDHW